MHSLPIATVQRLQPKLSALSIVIMAAVLIYVLLTRPLLFSIYLPKALRAVIELIPLLLLLLSFRNKFRSEIMMVFLLSIYLLINYLVNDSSLQTSFLVFTKLAFFLLMLDLLASDTSVRKLLRPLLVKFWMFVSLSVIFSFVLYWVADSAFTYAPLVINDAGDGYEYYNNILLGNIRLPYSFGMQVPKSSWYFNEAGQLSCFFALNLVGAKYLVSGRVKCFYFQAINLLAGLCTLSATFYFLLFVLLVFWLLMNMKSIAILLVALIMPLLIYVTVNLQYDWLDFFLNESTSFEDRGSRFFILLDLLSRYPEKTLLIGNGAGLVGLGYDRGLTSGWIVHLAERGSFFTLALATYVFILLRGKMLILFVVAYYNFSFEFFEYPIFTLMLALIVRADEYPVRA